MAGRRLRSLAPPLCSAATLFAACPAAAQSLGAGFLESEIPWDVSRGENVGVLDRPRPDYEAAGVQEGSFTLYPRVTTGLGFTTNAYAQKHDKVGDGFATLDPSVTLQSDWTRNALGLTASAALRRFFDQTPRNENGFDVTANGRLDLGSDTLSAQASILRGYSQQYAGDYPINAKESFQYTIKTAQVRDAWQGARFRVIGSADVNRITFNDPETLDGGHLDGAELDRTVGRASGRVEFGATPDTAAFVQLTYLDTNYDSDVTLGQPGSRSSHEVRALSGVTFDLSGLFRGAIGLGYTSRDYSAARFGHIAGLAADARVQWFATPLTTATLQVTRSVEDAVFTQSAGFFATTANLRIDHELLRNLLLNLNAGYQLATFKESSRHDRVYSAAAGANYFVNRQVGLNLNLQYLKRDSQGVGGIDFDEVQGRVGITFQL